MKNKAVQLLMVCLIISGVVIASYWGGAEAGRYLEKPAYKQLLQSRERSTKRELGAMQTIKVGMTLPNYEYLEDLSSKVDTLSHVIHRPTWILFMQADCEACLEEVEKLHAVISKTSNFDIALISSSNPLDLMDVRDHYKLAWSIFHDRYATFTEKLGIYSYPFNILVDSNLAIKNIVVGQLYENDIEQSKQ